MNVGHPYSNHGGHYAAGSSSNLDFVDSILPLDYNVTSQYSSTFHGHGLNLSTNHGLDLTCPNYEGLNLSVSHTGNHGSSAINLAHRTGSAPHPPTQPPGPNVGLNLTVQNGINLSRDTNPDGKSQPTPATAQNQPYFYNSNPCNGYINLTPQNQRVYQNHPRSHRGKKPSQMFSQAFEAPSQAQNSPLNLEQHRASPLNLTNVHTATVTAAAGSNATGPQNSYVQSKTYYESMMGGGYNESNMYTMCPNPNGYGNNLESQPAYATNQPTNYNMYNNNMYQPQPSGFSANTDDNQGTPLMTSQASASTGKNAMNMTCSTNLGFGSLSTNKVRLFCSSCNHEFQNTSALNKHMEIHNNVNLPTNGMTQTCSECNIQVKDQEALYHHTQRVHPSNPVTVTCAQAKPSTSNNEGVMTMMSSGTNPVGPCLHTDPGGTLMDHTTLDPSIDPNLHVQQMQVSGDEVGVLDGDLTGIVLETAPINSTGKLDPHAPTESCLDCSLTFSSGLDLRKHIDLAHQGRQCQFQFQCHICDHYFPDKSALKTHVDDHNKEKPYKCDKCGANLSTQAGLNRHMKRHETNFPLHCHDCGKGFHERHDLQRHVQRHIKLGLGPKCQNCDKSFPSEKVRDKHKCKAPLKSARYPCEFCDSRLETKMAWGYHMWKHTKDSKYIVMSEDEELPSIKDRAAPALSSTSFSFDRQQSSLFSASSKLSSLVATKS
ncbi:hypothetical protein TCAL_01854 [Tigriopus californicus]|uniref:C2H2-type domain-containing protein n=2 Tax=Tigriopus californicus TaxID=6832 RepID=A0A553NG12_TIGCA|nr:hypothetical protein TCAL_01854 [Tigriopus californicus]|eukprot:TCALIF_01854-PA protein Name:"Similar to Znf316 Zinc finger protein 316 (Mus musculus)" AED:0.21 eAED:0.21 QI:0/-1/0/1/-1/1/1/0/713